MTQPDQVSFDQYLQSAFAGPDWLDMRVGMLSVFVEDIDACQDDPGAVLPSIAPAIVDQVVAVAGAAGNLEHRFRRTAEQRGPQFQTTELGAILWWAGMALHRAMGAAEAARREMAGNGWENAFAQIHALLYDSISALSLLSVAGGMMHRMEREGVGRDRLN